MRHGLPYRMMVVAGVAALVFLVVAAATGYAPYLVAVFKTMVILAAAGAFAAFVVSNLLDLAVLRYGYRSDR